MAQDTAKKFFTKALENWHNNENNRSLPWKDEKDPYRIWLSEIILQQTRAAQGLPYYLKFIETYPAIKDMAAANDEEVFRLWQGLGYYNRCKNMLATARIVTSKLNGKFPDTYEEILQLKGIGPYTAAAISSFAFGLPHAVVDGNVYRILSRYFAIDTPYDGTDGKKIFAALAQELINKQHSASHNQAIMDLGATVCLPQAPRCGDCPLQKHCLARKHELVDVLPVKSRKLAIRTRYFHYLLLIYNDRLWIRKRTGKDIWENLHEPFLIEHQCSLDVAQLITIDQFRNSGIPSTAISYEGTSRQRLTHQIIETRFFTIKFNKKPEITLTDGKWLHISELNKTAFPKTLLSFLKNNLYF